MIISTSQINKSAWVKYLEDVELLIRPLSVSKQEEFKAEATEQHIELIAGRQISVDKVDNAKYEALLRDWVIEDWKGFVDPSGAKIECNTEIKLLLLDYMHDMRRFAIDTALNLHWSKNQAQGKNSQD